MGCNTVAGERAFHCQGRKPTAVSAVVMGPTGPRRNSWSTAATGPVPEALTADQHQRFIANEFTSGLWQGGATTLLVLATCGTTLPFSLLPIGASTSRHVFPVGCIIALQLLACIRLQLLSDQSSACKCGIWIAFASLNLVGVVNYAQDTFTFLCKSKEAEPLLGALLPMFCLLHNLSIFSMLSFSPLAVTLAAVNHGVLVACAYVYMSPASNDGCLARGLGPMRLGIWECLLLELVMTVPSAIMALGMAKARKKHFCEMLHLQALASERNTIDLWKLAETHFSVKPPRHPRWQQEEHRQQPMAPADASLSPASSESEARGAGGAAGRSGDEASGSVSAGSDERKVGGIHDSDGCRDDCNEADGLGDLKQWNDLWNDKLRKSELSGCSSEQVTGESACDASDATGSETSRLMAWESERERERQEERDSECLAAIELSFLEHETQPGSSGPSASGGGHSCSSVGADDVATKKQR